MAALLFALTVLIGFNVPGPGATFDDPGKVLTYVAAHRWLWRLINILGIFLSGFAIVFAIGLWSRLRERAPTRAAASLAFALIGLAGYALANLLLWKGGVNMALYAAKDQVAASDAWLALAFAARSAIDTGNAWRCAAARRVGHCRHRRAAAAHRLAGRRRRRPDLGERFPDAAVDGSGYGRPHRPLACLGGQ